MKKILTFSIAFEAGDLAIWFGLIWAITTQSGVQAVSILLAATALARVGVGIAGSSLLKRLTIPAYLRATTLGYAAITWVMFFALLLGTSVSALIAIELFRSILATTIRVQRESLFRVAVEANNRIAGHWVSATHTVRVIIPSVAGALIAVISLPILCGLVAMVSGLAALLTGTQHVVPRLVTSSGPQNMSIHADVQWLTAFMLLANAATAPIGIFLPAILVQEYHVGVVSFGVAEGLLGLGCVIGALTSPSAASVRLSHLYGGAIVQACLYTALWYSAGILVLYVLLFFIGICIGFVQACILSAYLRLIPSESYGAIRSRQMALAGVIFAISSAVAGLLATSASFRLIPIYQATFWIFAFIVLAIAVRWRTTFYCVESQYVES